MTSCSTNRLALAAVAVMVSLSSSADDNPGVDDSTFRPLLENFENGHINWQTGEYHAKVAAPVPTEYRGRPVNEAMGKELALRVSRALADSVFLQIVAETRVDAKQRLSALVKDDAAIRLSGNIRGKELVQAQIKARGSKKLLEASYRIPMRGVVGVLSNVYEKAMQSRTNPETRTSPAPGPGSHTTQAGEEQAIYIDARGTGLQPALFPDILDPNGTKLFDPVTMGKSHVVNNGVVEYMTAQDDAPVVSELFPGDAIVLAAATTGELVLKTIVEISHAADEKPERKKRKKRKAVKATQAEGIMKSNIIVGSEDAEKLRKARESGELTDSPRIIVITDGTVGGTEGRLPYPPRFWALLVSN